MNKVLVCGHQNPDTDSIVSAISYAHFLNATGVAAEAVALGTPAEETVYALEHFGFAAPRVIAAVEGEETVLALVDHNEAQQSVPERHKATIYSVVDHHRIANFETPGPLYYRAEPVGCSNTIIYKMYMERGVEIPQKLAGLMLSAVISDTLLMKSPTCTDEDVKAMNALAALADVNLETYGLALLKAGTNLSSKSEAELLNLDAKSFPMGAKTVRIAQVNTVDEGEVLARQEALLALMNEAKTQEGYDLFMFLVTNILSNDSVALVAGTDVAVAEQAFDCAVEDSRLQLPGVVSRKKQVVPPLTKAFEN